MGIIVGNINATTETSNINHLKKGGSFQGVETWVVRARGSFLDKGEKLFLLTTEKHGQ